MTHPTDTMVEQVARAMFLANPTRNKALLWESAACPRNRYRKQAIAAIAAYEAALQEAGPSSAMVDAGEKALTQELGGVQEHVNWRALARDVWRAMLAVASPAPKDTEEKSDG